MTCLETLEYISRHFDGDLSQSEENELKKHIESCESCRREFEDIQQIFAELKNEKQAELPSNFHEELMEKLENQKVVPLKTAKKNKINYRKYMAAAASFIVLAIVGVSGTKGLIKNNTSSASDIARAESADIAAYSEDSGILTAEAGSAESIIIDDSTEKSSAKEISEGSKAEENGTAAQKTEDKAVLTPKAEVPKEKNVQKPKIEENKANEPQKAVSQNTQSVETYSADLQAENAQGSMLKSAGTTDEYTDEDSDEPMVVSSAPEFSAREGISLSSQIRVSCENINELEEKITSVINSENAEFSGDLKNGITVYGKEICAEIKDILYENASVVSDNTTEETETLEIVLE